MKAEKTVTPTVGTTFTPPLVEMTYFSEEDDVIVTSGLMLEEDNFETPQ